MSLAGDVEYIGGVPHANHGPLNHDITMCQNIFKCLKLNRTQLRSLSITSTYTCSQNMVFDSMVS